MKFRDIDLSDNALNSEHERLGIPPLERSVEKIALADSQSRVIRGAVWLSSSMLALLICYLLIQLFGNGTAAAKALVGEALASDIFGVLLLLACSLKLLMAR